MAQNQCSTPSVRVHVVNSTAAAGQLVEIAEAGTVTCVSGSDLVRPMPCCPWTVAGQLSGEYHRK